MQYIDVLELSLWAWMDTMLWLTWARARSQERLREFLRGSQNEVVVLLWVCEAWAWDRALCHSKRHSLGKQGKKPHVPAPSLLINAVLFKLHQYLPCNKASQYVDVLFRAQLLSRKQFPNNRGRDEWPARAEAACSGRVCTAVSLPCP